MAYVLITGTDIEAKSSDGNGFTTGSCDTTGATLAILGVAYYNLIGAITLSDSKSNTYTPRTEYSNTGYTARIYYCASPTVGSGHTFTLSGNSTYACLFAAAFSGAHATPYDQENGNTSGSGATLQPGSITPTEDNELIITVAAGNVTPADPTSINGGYTITGHFANSVNNVAGGMAYVIQTTAAATNPTWTYTGDAPNVSAAAIASFKAAAAATGQPTMRRWGGTPFVGGQGIGQKSGGSNSGREWGRSRSSHVIVPRWLADQERRSA